MVFELQSLRFYVAKSSKTFSAILCLRQYRNCKLHLFLTCDVVY